MQNRYTTYGMKVLFVYAHEDPQSFGAALHNRALSYFERGEHKSVVSDLYALGFHAVAEKWDFVVSGGPHQNYMLEQKRVADKGLSAFSEDIKEEITKLRNAELVIFEFPLWWSAAPAIMKGWFDKIFAMGIAWDGDHRYQHGLLAGKKALVVTTSGDPEDYYATNGMHGATVEQHLYPLLHSTFAHAGMDVLKPFVAHNLTIAEESERQDIIESLERYLEKTTQTPEYIYKHN